MKRTAPIIQSDSANTIVCQRLGESSRTDTLLARILKSQIRRALTKQDVAIISSTMLRTARSPKVLLLACLEALVDSDMNKLYGLSACVNPLFIRGTTPRTSISLHGGVL